MVLRRWIGLGAGLLLALAVVTAPAQAKRAPGAKKAPEDFVVVDGPAAGATVLTLSGTSNYGNAHGTVSPQTADSNFTFTGTLEIPEGATVEGSYTVVPKDVLPPITRALNYAMDLEEAVLNHPHLGQGLSITSGNLKGSQEALNEFKAEASNAVVANQLTADQATAMNDLADSAILSDQQAQHSHGKDQAHAIREGLTSKRQAFMLLPPSLLGLPPLEDMVSGDTPDAIAPAPSSANAIDEQSGNVIGTEGTAPQTNGFIIGPSFPLTTLPGSAPSIPFTFDGSGNPAGQINGVPGLWQADTGFGLFLLPEPPDPGPGYFGGAQAADGNTIGGFIEVNGAEDAVYWSTKGRLDKKKHGHSKSALASKRKKPKGYQGPFTVGRFPGGSSIFTLSGTTAFGDFFLSGTSGPFHAFRADLRTRRVTELFTPPGGSAQPIASIDGGLAAGAVRLADGSTQGTMWWGDAHYLPFESSGRQTIINGLNDAGVGVGTVGPAGSTHAAMFEKGQILDLNDLIAPGSGWVLTRAADIDNEGRIVGTGLLNGEQRAFELGP